MSQRIYLFKRFERFWHWSQAALIIAMLVTGFEVHGSYSLLGFQRALGLHTLAAWALITLWVFAIFWHFTTGEWRQYIPTLKNADAMFRYYVLGIFTGAPHPYRVTQLKKHNPLQRLAYLGVKLFINPLIWISGLALLYHAWWRDQAPAGLDMATVALVHTVAAFMMLIFFIAHVYLATTGHTPLAHIRAMITGYEEVDD
ncbi:MAG: cytochrome b/b6 domain-containing protein [Sideroxyarcus sp.]|nr:cytochrome b/b6 domain-containing protein [Sideroxyarcus sp.]